jgi:hypothetical protein
VESAAAEVRVSDQRMRRRVHQDLCDATFSDPAVIHGMEI